MDHFAAYHGTLELKMAPKHCCTAADAGALRNGRRIPLVSRTRSKGARSRRPVGRLATPLCPLWLYLVLLLLLATCKSQVSSAAGSSIITSGSQSNHHLPPGKLRRSPSIEIVVSDPHNFANHPMYMNSYLTYSDCDRIFISKSLNASFGTVNGTFEGPTLPQYPPPVPTLGPNETTPAPSPRQPHARQCIFTFIAGENERVRLSFTKFSLRSEAPECLDEYMDLYTEMPDPKTDLLSTPFGGRFCDQIIPPDRISLYRTIVIAFYTEKESTIGEEIFQGKYEFINATRYIAGTQMPNTVCSFAVYSDQRREGEFMSPTYPGVYPKDINCRYLFKGNPGQRVKLEFMDFDLYYGGSHCPLDYMKIYDGDSENAPLIGTYCGQQRQLFVFSSGTSLFLHFSTMKRIAETQNRGFSSYFEFSEKFVNLGFIGGNETSEHILGSECDQKILSKKESNGTIFSPNYPFLYHSNIQCKYYLYGLQDAQNLERINFHFEMLQIPTKDINECTDAYVRLYTQTTAMDEFDYIFCGETLPPPVVSEGPVLLIVFNSGSSQGQGFKAHYWFETDYKIPGTQALPGQCQFSYMSASGEKRGDFNSPRHPSNYPSSTFCTYEFFGEPDEQVMVTFSHFKFNDIDVGNQGVPGYNEVCNRDWLEIYTIDPNGKEQFYGRYCSMTAPGPIISEPGVSQMKIISNTDDADVSSGFLATYSFIKKENRMKDCGLNITGLENGIITTPNYPNIYPPVPQMCNWFITVRPGHQVLFHFETFSVEGEPTSRGCAGAIVRVWTNPASTKPVELCGEKLDNSSREFLSESNVFRITFFKVTKAIDAPGFRAVWTEVTMPVPEDTSLVSPVTPLSATNRTSKGRCRALGSPPSSAASLESTPATIAYISPTANQPQMQQSAQQQRAPTLRQQFQCKQTEYCLSETLRCNGIANCGFGDASDEAGCTKEAQLHFFDLLGGIAGLTLFSSFTIGILCLIGIMLANWFRRRANEVKENNGVNGGAAGANNNNQKPPAGVAVSHGGNAYLHMSPHYHLHQVASIHPSGSRTGSPRHVLPTSSRHGSPFRGYPTELTGSTPTHRVIEVMTVGSHSSSQGKTKWSTLPSTSSEGPTQLMLDDDPASYGHHGHHGYLHDADIAGLDSPGLSNASIPPPPPPPVISTSGYIITGRPTTSSLANFYAERPVDLVGGGGGYRVQTVGDPAGSVTSIDRYGYRTMGRLQQQPSLNSASSITRAAMPTFGYGPAQSSFHTLPHHHVASHSMALHHQGSSLNYELAPMRSQQKLSPSGEPGRASEMMMDQIVQTTGAHSLEHNGGGTLDDDESSLSLRMAATKHLQAYGNGGGTSGSGEGDIMLGEVEEDHSELMMAGLGGPNHNDYKTKRFAPTGSYMLSEQSDSLLIDE